MTVSHSFRQELYSEHVAEASFLYGQRRSLVRADDIGWNRIKEVEERLEAHLDALVLGGGHAATICLERVSKGEPGELYAATCICCRISRKDLLLELLEFPPECEMVKLDALREALRDELPHDWEPDLLERLRSDVPRLAPVLAHVFAARGLLNDTELVSYLHCVNRTFVPGILALLGRTAASSAADSVEPYLEDDSPGVREQAVRALLWMGSHKTREWLAGSDSREDWRLLLLALSGGPYTVDWFLERASDFANLPAFYEALGLLGDARAIEVLLDGLNNSEVAGWASRALRLITGAEPGAKARKGAAAFWRQWCARNRAALLDAQRYRKAQPVSPSVLFTELASTTSLCRERAAMFDELAIRYAIRLDVEVEAKVARQISVLRTIVAANSTGHARFVPGAWYCFGGRAEECSVAE